MSTTTFTLELVGGANQSLAAWGLDAPVATFNSLGSDTLTISAPGRAVDAARLFNVDDAIKLHRIVTPDSGAPVDTVIFAGTLIQPGEDGAGQSEAQTYEFRGPWELLVNLPYQQLWTVSNGSGGITTARRPRVHLFSNLDGTPNSISAEITAVLTYALSCVTPAPFQIGTIQPGTSCPAHEALDISCAEAIRICLRYAPDCVTWFDYSTAPPTLHIQPAANLTAVSIAPIGTAERFNLKRNYQQEVSQVAIFYEIVDSAHPEFASVTIDAAPPGSTGNAPGALCATINLQGGQSQTKQSQELQAAPLYQATAATPSSAAIQLAWWANRVPELADALDSQNSFAHSLIRKLSDGTPGVDFGKVSFIQIDDDGNEAPLNYNDPTHPDTYYPNELVYGAITPWMQQPGSWPGKAFGIHARVDTAIHYYVQGPTDSGGTLGKRHVDMHVPLSVKLIATDGATHLEPHPYMVLTGGVASDTPPTGLAAALYAALNRPQYNGTIALASAEIGDIAVGMGNTLNLTGLRSEWASMAALITSVQAKFASGTLTLTFSPTPQLGTGELVQLMQISRNRRIPDVTLRQTGENGGSRTIQFPTWTPQTSGSRGKGDGGYQQFSSGDVTPTNNVVEVDPDNGSTSVTYES